MRSNLGKEVRISRLYIMKFYFIIGKKLQIWNDNRKWPKIISTEFLDKSKKKLKCLTSEKLMTSKGVLWNIWNICWKPKRKWLLNGKDIYQKSNKLAFEKKTKKVNKTKTWLSKNNNCRCYLKNCYLIHL